MDAITGVYASAFGCNKAHRIARRICREEGVLHVNPIRHMQLMQKSDPTDLHRNIRTCEDNENSQHHMYKYVMWWWAEAMDKIMLTVNAIWPDKEWEAKNSVSMRSNRQ